uniref:BRO1 domain-containing protein n=2 Tax=Mesocestoides corti TaxID=53468 RepID=A0A5K3F7U1_MESCO
MPDEDGNVDIFQSTASDDCPTIALRKRSEDSRYVTKRTELHHKKSEIIPDINKALRIKRGAENLLHANERAKISNKENKMKIEDVLDVESAALGTLKDKMDYLNSNFSTYQNLKSRLPMIPIGLKDTDPVDFKEVLSPFISSHYHQDPSKFSKALEQLTLYREAVSEPRRSLSGLRDFRKYYDLLNTIERRFFDVSVHHGFRFSWSDAFTGERHSQRSPAFEKGALIFNYAALCSQIATASSEASVEALTEQVQMFMQARANLQVLRESFAHAPSRDMSSDVLDFLIRVMQAQTQEALFMKQLLESQDDSDFIHLEKYIGGASFLSEIFGKLASPPASGSGSSDWTQVERVIPSSWISLLELKSQYYQAQINYKLATTLLCLAICGKPKADGPFEVGPLPPEGLFNDDEFLENEVSRHLSDLFSVLKPNVQLHKLAVRERRRGHLHRRRNRLSMYATGADGLPRSQSRMKRTLSSLSFGGFGRNKSHGFDDASSFSGRFSSLSLRSGYSSASAPASSMSNLAGIEGDAVEPPTTRKDAHLLGQVCLAEAIMWARQALQTIEGSTDLNHETDFKAFVNNDVLTWSEEYARVTKANGQSSNMPPVAKPRRRWLSRSKSFNHSTAGDSASVISTATAGSKKSSRAEEKGVNPWIAPTFHPSEIQLPKDTSPVLKTGKNMLEESKDPFRLLGPLKFFNARKCWSEAYTVQLVRNEEVAYGFSIQGTGPVEILGVDPDTPASDNGLRTSDLIVSINGMDARFMTHNEAVAAIRFGAEGYDRALAAQRATEGQGSFPQEVDVVQLTLVRPVNQPVVARKPSTYLVTPEISDVLPSPTPKHPPTPKKRHKFWKGKSNEH